MINGTLELKLFLATAAEAAKKIWIRIRIQTRIRIRSRIQSAAKQCIYCYNVQIFIIPRPRTPLPIKLYGMCSWLLLLLVLPEWNRWVFIMYRICMAKCGKEAKTRQKIHRNRVSMCPYNVVPRTPKENIFKKYFQFIMNLVHISII